MSMKRDVEPDSTPELSSVCAHIHQSSEHSFSLMFKGCIEVLLWWGPHVSAQALTSAGSLLGWCWPVCASGW